MDLDYREWQVLRALAAALKAVRSEDGRTYATFNDIPQGSWSDSYLYSRLRSLHRKKQISIFEGYWGGGYSEWPQRRWEYRLSPNGRRRLQREEKGQQSR